MVGRQWNDHSARWEEERDEDDDELELELDDEVELELEDDDELTEAESLSDLDGASTAALLPPPPAFSWRWFTTSLVILAALFFLELGIHPAVAAVMLCFKLSLPDLLNAWWLLRRDPRPGRGILLAMFYAVRAFWGVVGYSIGLMMLLAFAAAFMAKPGQAGPVDFDVVGLALAMTFTLMGMAAGTASFLLCAIALLGGARIWLASEVTPWRRLNHFPPFPAGYEPGKNQVSRFAYVTMIAVVAVGMILFFSVVAVGQAGGPGDPGMVLAAVLAGVIGAAVSILLFPRLICLRIEAKRPDECWSLTADERRRVTLANGSYEVRRVKSEE
jgi:hypothetical protein